MNETVFLTGSTGMVGKNTLEKLKVKGYTVLNPSRSELDLTNQSEVRSYFRSNKIDIVIHAAGLVGGIQANINSPFSFLSINAEIALNVINGAISSNVQKLINLGSSCMYPKGCSGTLSEEMILSGPLEPTNEGYALAKIMAYKLCCYAQFEHGLSYKTLIPCNLFGKYDNFHPTRSHMIPSVIRKIHYAKRSNKPVEIWGLGNVRREFMFVEDLVDFILLSIIKYEQLPPIMNVGIGTDFTIKEYYEIISEVIGYSGTFIHDLKKPEGMNKKLCSIKRQNEIGWAPKHSLKEGIEKTYKFYLETYEI